ncbi:DUF881 domain-containing protein [Nocardioides donggukensis]|uniref:DUF881 domain-containing protein n=1 Tax=Nocardioides donggukensis TaxID=2774019 RepID=A0A927Q1C8_9ACTN|nr:DUF881 domain-containing protein [Nocardioides donggukensis]MBD8869339.1 DUF881 domain-containing protein [Nocardioides donggukensis]
MPDQPDQPDRPDRPSEERSGRERLLAALRSGPSRAQAVVAVLLAMVGFAAMTQVQSTERDDDFTGLRQSDLIRVFDGLAASTERAENEIDRLTETRDDLRSSTESRQAALDLAREESATLSILAGTVPTTGPGIRMTITDERGEVDSETLLDIIQELRAAGAEAMEFNDRIRVVAQTSVEDIVTGISLDGQEVEPPYVIDVIGEPTTLAGSLDFPQGPRESVEDRGGTVSFEELDAVLIESTVEAVDQRFAEPREGE